MAGIAAVVRIGAGRADLEDQNKLAWGKRACFGYAALEGMIRKPHLVQHHNLLGVEGKERHSRM